MRRDATNDGVVLGVAGGVDLAVEQRADKGVERQVDRVDVLEDHQRVAGHWGMNVVSVQPLHGLGGAGDDRRRLAELHRQGLDDLDLAFRQPMQHARQLVERTRAGLHPHAFAALAGVVQLELMLLRRDLFREQWRNRGLLLYDDVRPGAGLAFQEIERHVENPGSKPG